MLMEYGLTIFKNRFDNETGKVLEFYNWNSFSDLLKKLSEQELEGKENAQLISPALYMEGSTRSNKNVTSWGRWAAVDVDDYKGDINEILDRFSGTNFVVYSTASSTPEQIKFRLVVDLSRSVEGAEIKHFWFALNKFLGELGDPQTKDSSRMYYIPARYNGACNFFYSGTGDAIDVDKLKADYPYKESTGNTFLDKLPEGMKEKVLEHRKNSMTNTNVTWSGYRDCPFFPNKMADDYKCVSETGWYSQMYRIMVAVACNAVKEKYPITADQIASLCKELDRETGNWYENRPLTREASGAIEYAYANTYTGE